MLSLTVDETLKRITHEYEALSQQQKTIALYVEKNREHIGIERIREISQRCGVQPSAIVRFAKRLGFSGFSELQAMFRANLSRQLTPGRKDTARTRDAHASAKHGASSVELAQEFLAHSILGMQELQRSMDFSAFQNAVDLLCQSDGVWIAASRRSFSIAAYLEYALQHTDKRVMLMNTMAGMHTGPMPSVRRGDVILAISFLSCAQDTLVVARHAVERGAKLIVITDSGLTPLARLAAVTLVAHENTRSGFRSLCGAMGLAQSLFVAMACALEFSGVSPHSPNFASHAAHVN